jgi:hypothetical protein
MLMIDKELTIAEVTVNLASHLAARGTDIY